jgi:formate dehydrogenase major subunit
MSSITLTINGQQVSAQSGQTVLQAARAAGIDIPTLCHHPALAPSGGCRVCLVEVTGQRALQPACTFPVADRMQIQTESSKVVRARRFVLELLFSERNHFCMACQMSGGCELQALGYRYGLDHWVYPTYTQRFAVDASPLHHLMDHNRCVLCRRCVRACAELVGNHTLDLRQRGAHSMICADMDVPLGESSCVGCGTCVNVCPTGALVDKRSAFMAPPKDVARVATICTQCSIGCGLNVVMHRGQVLRLESRWDAPVNGGLLCRRGRFEALQDQRPRLLEPLLRENGRRAPASWNYALAEAARHLDQESSQHLGLLTSTRLTNDALALLRAIFVRQLRAAHRGAIAAATPELPLTPCGKLADIAGSDLILLVEADPVRDQPVASFFIKRAVDQGTRLVTVESRPTDLTPFAEATFLPRDMAIAVDLIQAAAKPVIIYGAGLQKSEADLLRRAEPRARLIPLVPGVNTVTAAALGLINRINPTACSTLFIAAADENGALDQVAAQIGRSAFVIVMACYASPLTERADLVLPMATWLERSGGFTNTDGTPLRAHAALPASGQSRSDWDILGRLAERLGLDAGAAKAELPRCGA